MKKFIAVATVSLFALTPSVALAVDPSDAVRYNSTAPAFIGTELIFEGTDDAVSEVALPFPINFFGTRYDTACVDINGTLHFLESEDDSCSGSNYNDPLGDLAADYESPVISALALDLILDEGSSIHAGALESDTMFAVTWSNLYTFNTWSSLCLDNDFMYTLDRDADECASLVPDEQLTFQLVIKKAAGGSDEDGFDFDLEWNYETINDLGSGYYCGSDEDSFYDEILIWADGQEPYTGEPAGYRHDLYQASNDFCWPVGWSNYDSDNAEGVDVFDLFAGTNRRQMIDGGSESLIGNRLNSDINGRYILTMSGGNTVGFPTSNNSPAAPAATTTPKLATTGANVEWLMFAGFIALIAGASFLTVSRRKRTA